MAVWELVWVVPRSVLQAVLVLALRRVCVQVVNPRAVRVNQAVAVDPVQAVSTVVTNTNIPRAVVVGVAIVVAAAAAAAVGVLLRLRRRRQWNVVVKRQERESMLHAWWKKTLLVLVLVLVRVLPLLLAVIAACSGTGKSEHACRPALARPCTAPSADDARFGFAH